MCYATLKRRRALGTFHNRLLSSIIVFDVFPGKHKSLDIYHISSYINIPQVVYKLGNGDYYVRACVYCNPADENIMENEEIEKDSFARASNIRSV